MVHASTGANSSPNRPDWLTLVTEQSQLAIALLEPGSLSVQQANRTFTQLTGLEAPQSSDSAQKQSPCDFLADFNETDQEQLYRRHLLRSILRDVYQFEGGDWRFLDEPIVAQLKSPLNAEERYIEFWLRSRDLHVQRIDPSIDELANLDLQHLLQQETLSQQQWEEKIQWSNYRVAGQLLWEGLEVTAQQQIQRLATWLIQQETLLEPDRFATLGEKLRSLFRASSHVLLAMKPDRVQVLLSTSNRSQDTADYTFEALEGSPFLRAAEANRIWNVPDLEQNRLTALEDLLFEGGLRSLLIVPLWRDGTRRNQGMASFLFGFVAVGSDRANAFNRLDAQRARTLIPAFKAAFRQMVREKLTRIHPAVEWRFRQEAERRSLGQPPQPIVFEQVYPMYGISDVRGSTTERNLAIKSDLLAQFDLALDIVKASVGEGSVGFLHQLEIDLQLYGDRLAREIRAEDEISALDYLKKHFEVYFDYFRQCGPQGTAAVDAYQRACTNDHQSVYQARDRYDQALHSINAHLRKTWERAQAKMQQILPHYCDLEIADGIDHVLYVGASIASQFSLFHLHSLRYEQLRGICDCARTCLQVRNELEIPLDVSHLILVQQATVDIFHDEKTDKLFDVRGTRDSRYEIVKKRIDKAKDAKDGARITQPGMLSVVYSTHDEWLEYHQYLRYLVREGWIHSKIESGAIEPLPGVTGLKYARVRVLSDGT
ncbi:MAG: GAF domain-containing protein [Cyanobacteriota bacterium]|nr:GAF domain-containing protein [Cyanobacteriota bacterium]